MNFPLFVSRRYLFSKKSTHAINLISIIAVLGVTVATTAMVVVMSSFNGFADLIASLFTEFDPQIKVQPATGKATAADDPALLRVKQLPFVQVATESVEDQALAVYRGRQVMVTVKGVENNFDSLTNIRNILYGDGDFRLSLANLDYAVPGIWIAKDLGTGTEWPDYLHLYAPQRQGQYDATNPTEAFTEDSVLSPGVVFQVKQSRYDRKYILTSIALARRLFDRQGEITSLELRLKPGVDINEAKDEIKTILGNRYTVKDRYEQQADNFKVMQVEKLFAYAFLTFILLVACFNIVGSLSMLIIDKRQDIATLRFLGANERTITRIFLLEGRLITLAGAILGIGVGLLLCLLQQQYGLVKLGNSSGNYIVDAYPVSVHPWDVVLIFATVIAVGWLAVYFPVRYMSRKTKA